MSDLVPVTANDVVVSPSTGELVNLTDPANVARALRELREHDQQVRDVKNLLVDALVHHAQQAGTKTMHIEGVGKVTLSGGPESDVIWDIDTLEALREAGLPEERWNELVTMEVSYRVNSAVAKSIAAANPVYGRIVDAARKRADRPWRAAVSR